MRDIYPLNSSPKVTTCDHQWPSATKETPVKRFSDSKVKDTFNTYPKEIRTELLSLRELIFTTAASQPCVGQITETLKWGEPAYLTEKSKSGSTIRIGWKKSAPDQYSMYFNCQTNLIETFRTLFAEDFKFEGNREIVFQVGSEIPKACLALCIEMAQTYHLSKPIPNTKLDNRKEL
jgi:hypothetical protein